MHMAHLAQRYPHELSGSNSSGWPSPPRWPLRRVLLLDKPFRTLDSAVRERLQIDLAALQAEQSLIIVYVTHRLEDALPSATGWRSCRTDACPAGRPRRRSLPAARPTAA